MAKRGGGSAVRRSKEQWLELIESQASSGLSQRRFCEDHGVSVAAFGHAKFRYRDTILASMRDAREAFLAVDVLAQGDADAWDVELALGSDVVLRLRRR